jgi:chaperonin cofactor prefoldin
MKSRESLVRLKEFQVNEKRRQLQQLQMMTAEFDRMTKDLETQIVLEEKKSGISDPSHFAYPTFAKAARARADNLQVSIRELRSQEEALESVLEEMQADYAKAAALEERDSGGVRARA